VNSLVDRLLHLHGVLVYLVVAALVFAEDALFVGFVLPVRPPPYSAASSPARAVFSCG